MLVGTDWATIERSRLKQCKIIALRKKRCAV